MSKNDNKIIYPFVRRFEYVYDGWEYLDLALCWPSAALATELRGGRRGLGGSPGVKMGVLGGGEEGVVGLGQEQGGVARVATVIPGDVGLA